MPPSCRSWPCCQRSAEERDGFSLVPLLNRHPCPLPGPDALLIKIKSVSGPDGDGGVLLLLLLLAGQTTPVPLRRGGSSLGAARVSAYPCTRGGGRGDGDSLTPRLLLLMTVNCTGGGGHSPLQTTLHARGSNGGGGAGRLLEGEIRPHPRNVGSRLRNVGSRLPIEVS